LTLITDAEVNWNNCKNQELVARTLTKDWPLALNQFEILCGDFKYDLLESKK
jgi:hypothetical protein